MKILVTGTAGFIAGHLASKLVMLGHEVVGVDKREMKHKAEYKQITGDLSDWSFVNSLESFDVIYHIAGHSAGDLSIENYEEDIRDNLLATAHIIKFAQQRGSKQIIYASTMALYGDQEVYPVNESAYPHPKVYYSANKFASEQYLKIASTESLSTTSIRLFNIYGPGQDINNLSQGMVSIFIGELLRDHNFKMRGKPTRFRDFLYIDDVVDGFVQCLGNKEINGEVLNFASGEKHSLGELVDLIRERLPFETTVSYVDPSSFDLNWMHGDISKAKKLIGFDPKVSLEKGIELTMEWVLKNSNLIPNKS